MSDLSNIRVAGHVADKTEVTLFLEDGTTMIVKQGDHRLRDLLEKIVPINARGEIAVVNLDDYSLYADFEKKTGGLVKFFTTVKKKAWGLFGKAEEPEVVTLPIEAPAQSIPVTAPVETIQESKPVEPLVRRTPPQPEPVKSAHERIKPDLKPMAKHDADPIPEETVVAVIGDTVIPDVHKIKHLILHAAKNNSTIGVENFLKRIAAVIDKRSHSMEDVMRFLEKGDLPLADDGSIIAYKRLNRMSKTHFVDCHTGKVTQRLGSFVCVDEKLVDKNRANECSNGLHIARRGYLRSFSGNVCIIAKIAPEDVITVPHGDPNKVRVCAYHIVGVLNDEAFNAVTRDNPMTGNTETTKQLLKIIAGDHIHKIEEVKIHGSKGEGVVITPLDKSYIDPTEAVDLTEKSLQRAKATDDPSGMGGAVNPREINKMVADTLEKDIAKEAVKSIKEDTSKPKSNKDNAKEYYDVMIDESIKIITRKQAAESLKVLKSKAKVSYEKLGLKDNTASRIEAVLSPDFEQKFNNLPDVKTKKVKPNPMKTGTPHTEGMKPAKKEPETINNPPSKEGEKIIKKALEQAPKHKKPFTKKDVKDAAKFAAKVNPEPKKKVTKPEPAAPEIGAPNKEWARYYFLIEDWHKLYNLKKTAKVNWNRLGFVETQIDVIAKNKP